MKLDYDTLFSEINSMATREWHCPTLGELPPMPPEKDDPNILFENNFLSKGQSMATVSSSGAGKSSMNVQMSYHWALGKTFLATPTRPLKIAIIQTEDSPRDVDDQRRGMRNGLSVLDGWTAEEITAAERNIWMPSDFIGLQGDAFINLLKEFQADMKFDLISINPLQGVYGDDLSDQKAASHFCRAGLDPIMKHPDYGCACHIIMHSPKQKSGCKDGRASVDDYGEYMMAGSQEWTAWCRAIFAFLKHDKTPGVFDITCPKRGNKLQWSKDKRVFKFSPPEIGIFWQEITDDTEIAQIETARKKTSIDAEELSKCIDDLVNYLRTHPAQMRSNLTSGKVQVKSHSRDLLRAAGRSICDNPSKYRLTETLVKSGRAYAKYIGFADGIHDARTLAEQQNKIDATKYAEDTSTDDDCPW